MHLVVINCSPRVVSKSNTNIILQSFIQGYTKNGNTTELYHLSKQNSWDEIRHAFTENTSILFALPLFVECVPGLMLEFLETLSPKTLEEPETQISFLLQGGFAEASQFRCCERYLETLPMHLGCEYGGTLIKGNMFITHMLPAPAQQQTVSPFESMGEQFANDHYFDKKKVDAFAAPEYLSKGTIFISNLFNPIKKVFFHTFFGKMGCSGSLRAKPYAKYLNTKYSKK